MIITDLPDKIDPISLIKNKTHTCPLCGAKFDFHIYVYHYQRRADALGKVHKILTYKNRYYWERAVGLKCSQCGCEWDTDWYPIDHSMFNIDLKKFSDIDYFKIYQTLKNLGLEDNEREMEETVS